jgi:hypothetical protein
VQVTEAIVCVELMLVTGAAGAMTTGSLSGALNSSRVAGHAAAAAAAAASNAAGVQNTSLEGAQQLQQLPTAAACCKLDVFGLVPRQLDL